MVRIVKVQWTTKVNRQANDSSLRFNYKYGNCFPVTMKGDCGVEKLDVEQ